MLMTPAPHVRGLRSDAGALRAVFFLLLATVAAPRRSSCAALTVDNPTQAAAERSELAAVLERAGRYVLDYEDRFRNVAALETRTQSSPPRKDRLVEGAVPAFALRDACNGRGAKARCVRVTKAHAVFVRDDRQPAFQVFRDVFELNGTAVREGEPRIERLFAGQAGDAARLQARALGEQSDLRYDVGRRLRDLGSPTCVLLFLRPDNRARFTWTDKGKRRFGKVEALELAFEESARPTLFRQPGEDLPASGRVWVDVSRGTVVQSTLEVRLGERARALLRTEYRPDRDLSLWVPVDVREEYEATGPQLVFGPSKVTTRYANFHRFPVHGAAAEVAVDPELVELLRHAGEYVTAYERSFADLVAEETYTQSLPWAQHRTTRADLVFVRLAGEIAWASYRDVFEVNGRKVRERDDALVKLLSAPSTDRQELSRKLLAANAKYNAGRVKRTVNLPTLPLVFLLPRHQGRFAFRLGDRRTIESTSVVEVLFTETSRPTFVDGPNGAGLPASGRFWINPSAGTVVRSELEFDFGLEAEARVTTDYRPAPELAMWVPTEMRERYADVEQANVRTFSEPLDAVARYSRFRRFTVDSQARPNVPGE